MTVSYTGDVANGSSFGCFWKILYRWRGSVYKLIWRELIAYLCLYYFINFFYRFGLDQTQKTTFEKVKVYCRKNIESIPMSFVLGFYVTLIVKRWWDQYWILPMPDSLALYISASIQGQDERGRILRRTIMRYTMMAYIICLQRISFRVKKRFPTMQHLVDTGLMTDNEMKIYEKMDQKAKVLKFWMPVVWASNLVNRARLEGRIQSDHMVQTILTELSDFRRKLGRVMVYDNVSVPLVYTQVVTLAVYTYFLAALIGRQWVAPEDPALKDIVYPGYDLDLYFPIFLSLQFIFYIGWLKVAETLINPFGEDDDDFELNWLIDRHFKVSYMVVDEMHEEHPELLKDQYWEQVVPQDLPYNLASERFRKTEPQGSTHSLKVNANESVYADLTSVKRHSAIPDDVYAEYESVADSPLADGRKNWLQRQLSRVESFRSTSSSSSLFARNRANSAINGGIVTGYHGHHRPSLYERLMNRRSSKDARHSNRGIHRPSTNSLVVPEKGFIPNSRPRVPTPETHQTSPLTLTTTSPLPINKVANKMQYTNSDGLISSTMNHTYGSPTGEPRSGPIYAKKHGLSNGHTSQPPLPTVPLPNAQQTNKNNNNSNQTPPPPYDHEHSTSPNAMILSPIAENDTSPYSTSSTTHNNPSVYPSTRAIFGRKPSPPPMEELPPIPTLKVTSPQSSTNSSLSLKSEHGSGAVMKNGAGRIIKGLIDENMMFSADPNGVSNHSESFPGRINEGYETDEGDDGRRYMTIAEVNECRAELERSLTVQPIETPLVVDETPRYPPSHSPMVHTPSLRHGMGTILRQDAICLNDIDEPPVDSAAPPGELPGQLNDVLRKQGKMEADDDDGYHEKGSYSEDDDASNQSDKGDQHRTNDTNSHNSQSNGSPVLQSFLGTSASLADTDVRSHSADTLRSNASDSDSSQLSSFSMDQSLPTPSRQKPIRRKNTQPDIAVPKNSNLTNSNDTLSGDEKTLPATEIAKDCEVFV